MVHNIYVCLEHKLIWHSLRAAGRHASLSHGGATYIDMLNKGVFVDIGVCSKSASGNIWNRCDQKNLKMRDATEKELQLARDIRDGKAKRLS